MGEGQRQFLDVRYTHKTQPSRTLFHAKIHNIKKKCSPAHLNAIERDVKNKWRWQCLEEEEDGIPYSKWCQKSLVALHEMFSVFTKFW